MRRTTLAALCITASLALTACNPTGGDGKKDDKSQGGWSGVGGGASKKPAESKAPFAGESGPDIVDKALETTGDAKSLRVKGTAPDDEMGLINMDLALDTEGNCAGTMSVPDQGSLELINDGKTLHMKLDEKFIRSQVGKGQPAGEVDAAVDMMADRWVKTDATSGQAKQMASFCDLDALLKEFTGARSMARKGKPATIGGKKAITLHENDGKDRYKIYVAAEGEPYLLRITNEAPGQESIDFLDFDKPVDTTAPTGDVLDMDKLGGNSGGIDA
ncbi:hypothetical protein [Streptomyces sp. NBC_01304]|uniref:hypothetical protein n=1 Tax=Streptomyces sp. NBC_01304 TaxID=2903818 RepID=UPI002E136525|nr:hypothetical protein OG430_28950 [Streptomyces sp. NBC_01304]